MSYYKRYRTSCLQGRFFTRQGNSAASCWSILFFTVESKGEKRERRQKWINACQRGDSLVCRKNSFICSLHFVGGNDPTLEDPDPISAVARKEMVS